MSNLLERVDRPVANSSTNVPALSELADAVHDYGAKVAIQLRPGVGRNIDIKYLRTAGAVGPSAVPCFLDPSKVY